MNHCRKCGCTLDPGEGKICEECRETTEKTRSRAERLQMMIEAKSYTQMNIEEYLNEYYKN